MKGTAVVPLHYPERGTLIWVTTTKTTKKVSNKLFHQKCRLYALNTIYFQTHYLRTDISYAVTFCHSFDTGGNRLSNLTRSLRLCEASPYLPIWTLLGKAPIVSPQTQENSSKSWLQEILILLVKNCERHWGWRQLGKGQKGETMLEIHSCRVFFPAVARTLVRLRPAVDGPHARWGERDSGGLCLQIHTYHTCAFSLPSRALILALFRVFFPGKCTSTAK